MDLFPFGNPLLAKIYENMYIFKYPLDYKWKFNQLLVDTKASYSIINISDFPTTLPQNTQNVSVMESDHPQHNLP